LKPSGVRYTVLGVATANAFLLYLDRICMTAVVQSASFQQEMNLTKADVGNVISAFFFAYALGQTPAGWMADRFGPRRMLAAYIALWSLFTALTGFTVGLAMLVGVRLLCGLAEAGAYPASALLISNWFPFTQRARANSAVAFGGRIGNTVAPWLTAATIVGLGSWRPVLWIYGAAGLALAAAKWVVFRDKPGEHPWPNQAEKDWIAANTAAAKAPAPKSPWLALVTHPGLWLFNAGSLGMNVGWAFLVTWLAAYLQEVRGLDPVTTGRYVTMALASGMVGMLFGGWWCDWLTRRFGQSWGRRMPFLIGSSVCVAAYLTCPYLESPQAILVAAGVVAFFTDSMSPASWTISQDIGGKHVATTLAWSNMWGNLGAALIAKAIPLVLASSFHYADWREVFWLCAGGFVVLGVTLSLVDSTKTLRA
jgi:MFS family permease